MTNSEPELGQLYALWRDNLYLGRARFVEDEVHGKCFMNQIMWQGRQVFTVFVADHWLKIDE